MNKLLMFCFLILLMFSFTLTAEVPYDSYLYNRWMETIEVPHSYVPEEVYFGGDMGIGNFSSPAGLFVQQSTGEIYIADSGNNRIVRLDRNMAVLSVYEGFNDPQDVYVTEDDEIYIADSGNSQLVQLNKDGSLVRIIPKPVSDLIPEDFYFYPQKLVVDKSKRIYIVAQGVNEGLIELSGDGVFKAFFGASRVDVNRTDYLWKLFSSQEQRRSMARFVPTVYNNLILDSKGFLFVTTSAIQEESILNAIYRYTDRDKVTPVRRLNPKGDDILRRETDWFPPLGDIRFSTRDSSVPGPSSFGDVCVSEEGIYHVLDLRRGRVFTYDPDGILLSIFGGTGSRKGLVKKPTAIELLDGKILLLDAGNGSLNSYHLTEYGMNVQNALEAYYKGRYDESRIYWEKVLKQNANMEWAYWGIGNALYRKDEYKEAMEEFAVVRRAEPFSKAFKYHRKEVLEQYFGWIFAAIVISLIALKLLRRKLRKQQD